MIIGYARTSTTDQSAGLAARVARLIGPAAAAKQLGIARSSSDAGGCNVSGHSSTLLQAARLWEPTSAKGTRYMQGAASVGVEVVILPNRDCVEGDPVNGHTHTLFFQDGSSTQPRPGPAAPAEQPERARKATDRPNTRQQLKDDPLPF